MCGFPGLGKTTYAERLVDTTYPGALLLSSDDIRWTMQQGSEFKADTERFVRGVIENFVRGCLRHNRSVIVDATNLTTAHRGELLWYAKEVQAECICYWVRGSVAKSKRQSERYITGADIDRLTSNFQEPTEDEGFKVVIIENPESTPTWHASGKKR